jgi:PAS domain S-box-containing protein
LTGRPAAGTLGRGMSALETLGEVEEALEHINVPSYVLDEYGNIRWVNPAAERLVGDVRGKLFTSVVAPEEKRRAQEEFAKKVYGTATTTDTDVVVVDNAGNRLMVEVHSVRLREGDRVVGVFGHLDHEPFSEPVAALAALTPRQTEVLRLLEYGRSTHQIADELHLSRETVRNHIRHILKALGVHSRLEAVALARHEHLAGIGAD